MVLQGQIDHARRLLSKHTAAYSDSFQSIDDLLKRMPIFSVSHIKGLVLCTFLTIQTKYKDVICIFVSSQILNKLSVLYPCIFTFKPEYKTESLVKIWLE